MESESRRIWNRLYLRGASTVCPICGFDQWKGFGELGNLHIVLPAGLPTGEMMRLPAETGGMGAYIYACARCGFVRLHSKNVVDDDFSEPEQ